MGRKWRFALIGSLVTAGLLGGLAAGSHRFGPRFAFADTPRHHGFGLWHADKGADHLCGDHRDAAIDAAVAYLKRAIDPTDAQVEPFDLFAQSLSRATALMERVCVPASQAPSTAAASLEQMEAMMAAGLAALREVRPSFDALYAVLDKEQRETLDNLFAHESRS